MFASAIQPGVITLFSSTGTQPLQLFSTHTDQELLADSFIHLLNDKTSLPPPLPPAVLISPLSLEHPSKDEGAVGRFGYTLDQTVLHMQSPTIPRTYIQCPPVLAGASNQLYRRADDLKLRHPWMHIQVRNLGREWSFEVGLVDRAAHDLVVRCSTFQKQPRLRMSTKPILHLPLSFPSSSSFLLTTWSTIDIHFPTILQHAISLANHQQENEDMEDDERPTNYPKGVLPTGAYSHVSYVKIYATCRLRRIWFSEGGSGQDIPWELELYAAD